jgi:hypothetical protein
MPFESEPLHPRAFFLVQHSHARVRDFLGQKIVGVRTPEVERFLVHAGIPKVWSHRFDPVKGYRNSFRYFGETIASCLD